MVDFRITYILDTGEVRKLRLPGEGALPNYYLLICLFIFIITIVTPLFARRKVLSTAFGDTGGKPARYW